VRAVFDAATAEVGTELPEFVDAPSTRTDFVRYQGASGDMNPIHHDEGFARAAGFPTVFAVGMLQAGILGTYLADLFGPDNVRRFKVQFREQSWPGDVITYGGRVVARRGDEAGGSGGAPEIDLELHATRQTGGAHLVGWATVLVPG
jgi:acyl dehydratase